MARLDLGEYFPSLSINHVAMSKDMEKRFPHLYYIKMKISYDVGFIAIGVAMATSRRQLFFFFIFVFLCTNVFLRNRVREFVPAIIASIIAKFEQIIANF